MGQEKLLSSKECIPLLQRPGVQYPAPAVSSQLPLTSSGESHTPHWSQLSFYALIRTKIQIHIIKEKNKTLILT